MRARAYLAVTVVVALIALLVFGLMTKGGSNLEVGDDVPDTELARLGEDGTGRIADYRGRWVLVNFWASWCEPCRDEAPALERFSRDNADNGVVVLGANLDDTTGDAQAFVDEYGLTYPQLRDGDGEDRRDAFGMTGFPESFLVDPDGKVALIRRGPVTDEFLDDAVSPVIASGGRS